MGAANVQLTPKIWKDEDFGVLPIFCFNERKQLGDQVALHFFEPRYLRLLQIVTESSKDLNCFIYACTGHPQPDITAHLCSINSRSGSDITGTMTNVVKINQSWIDMADRLWWCRFQVITVKAISPFLQINYSLNFKCLQNDTSGSTPTLNFANHDASCTSDLYYDPELRMYTALCTPTTKKAIIKATMNPYDTESQSLRELPSSTIWYLLPDYSEIGANCVVVGKFVEKTVEDTSDFVTRDNLFSFLVGLDVSCVKKIRVMNVKTRIVIGEDTFVRCPRSQQESRQCYIAIVDFGITKGKFKASDVTLTPGASKQVFRKVSRFANKERLRLLYEGHICEESVFRRLPTDLINRLAAFLVY